MQRRSSIVTAMGAALLAAATAAYADVVCQTPGGSLKVRAACKPRERPVDPAALGLTGPAGAKGDMGNQGATGPAGMVDPALVFKRTTMAPAAAGGETCATQGCDLATDLLLDCEGAITSGTAVLDKVGRAANDDNVCEACVVATTAANFNVTAYCFPGVTTTTTTTATTASTTTATTTTGPTSTTGGTGTTTSSTTTTTGVVGSTTSTTMAAACCGGATRLRFTNVAASGNCGQVLRTNGSVLPLACGGLYFGGGQNTVPLPAILPDMGTYFAKVTQCSNDDAVLDNTTSAETGSNLSCTSVDCLFGAPLPIPNATSPPTSTCVINKVSTDASGTLDCASGDAQLALPLRSEIYLTGDLLPDPGIQPCPLCTGGTCKGGANNNMPCTPQTSDLGDPFPTSHDCPPANFIGALPIGFNLTSGTQSVVAIAGTGQSRVFCGYCRDNDDTGAFAQPAQPCIDRGVGVGSGCSQPAEACQQRDIGAFGPGGGGAQTITATGQVAGNLEDLAAHPAKLVSIFCIPPTFDATIDAAANLPGPGATALQGTAQLVP